jgi:hypothetical protein
MKHIFNQSGTFAALYAAQKWCRDNGISYGSLCRESPVGLMRGDVTIAKWRNLTAKERAECDGVMTGNFRDGPVCIEMKQEI